MRLILCFFILSHLSISFGGQPSKTDAVAFLQNWRNELNTQMIKMPTNPELSIRHQSLESDLQKEILDRVTFHIQSRQTPKISKKHFQDIIENMLETSQNQKNTIYAQDGPFLENMAEILKNAVEPNENPLEVMQSYMEYSGVLKPEAPDLFLNERNYINGNKSESGQPMDLDQAASFVDSKIFKQEKESLTNL